MRSPGEDWYRGTADAIYQNINLIEQAEPHGGRWFSWKLMMSEIAAMWS